jgi:hypothetical protein
VLTKKNWILEDHGKTARKRENISKPQASSLITYLVDNIHIVV